MARKKKTIIASTPAISRRFESLCEFSAWLESAPVTSGFNPAAGSENLSSTYQEFSGSESFAAANNLMLGGWDCGADAVREIMLQNESGAEIARRFALSVAGCVPCVPAFLAGSPAHMITIRAREISRPVVTICYNCAVGASTPAGDIQRAAAKLLNVVRGLEAGGVGVDLYVCSFSRGEAKDAVTLAVKIKSSCEPFNLLNMAYPLIHPSFNRRHKFAFIERCGGCFDSWDGFGYAISDAAKMKEMAAGVGIDNAACFCFDTLRDISEAKIIETIKAQ